MMIASRCSSAASTSATPSGEADTHPVQVSYFANFILTELSFEQAFREPFHYLVAVQLSNVQRNSSFAVFLRFILRILPDAVIGQSSTN